MAEVLKGVRSCLRLYLPEITIIGLGSAKSVCGLYDGGDRGCVLYDEAADGGGGAGEHPQQTADQTYDRVAGVGRIVMAR